MPTFDFARPFQFLMEDPNWLKKVLLAGVIFLIPIVGPFVLMGYQIRVMRAVAGGEDHGAPDLVFGEDLMTGLKAFVAVLGYMLPGLVIYIGGIILTAIIGAAMGDRGGDNPLPGLVMMGAMCVGGPLFFIGALLSPIAMLRFADTDEIGAAYRFGEVFSFLKNNFVNCLLAIVVGMIANMIGQLGIILCFVGVFFTLAASMMIQGHAWGQVLKIDRARTNAPVPTTPNSNMARAY